MKFYIVDDDQSILYVLQNIIEQNFNDEVVGMTSSSPDALQELIVKDVDIVLVDLLMPELSGVDLVRKVKEVKPNIRFVMISKVQNSEMRAEAYKAGIEFFINKPINLIEVKTVLKNVRQSLQMATQLSDISKMVNNFTPQSQPKSAEAHHQATATLNYLGMTSEKGTSDILKIISLMKVQKENYRNIDLEQLMGISEHERRIIDQRIRRAIKVGLANIANRLIDNPYDEQLYDISNLLFGYESVHSEMLYQQGKRSSGGRISIQKFLDGLVSKE